MRLSVQTLAEPRDQIIKLWMGDFESKSTDMSWLDVGFWFWIACYPVSDFESHICFWGKDRGHRHQSGMMTLLVAQSGEGQNMHVGY